MSHRWHFGTLGMLGIALALAAANGVCAQSSDEDLDGQKPETETEREIVEVPIKLKEQSWFTDVVATAVIQFPEAVEQPELLPPDDKDVSFVGLELNASSISNLRQPQAVVRFVPQHPGLSLFPSLEFRSATHLYRTPPTQFLVSVPQPSSDMTFEFRPQKTTVYVGEPLQVDVTWSSQEATNRFRSLKCYPEIFRNNDAEIVIPRCTAPEEQQMGMPFGGRRIIVPRVPPEDKPNSFGTVQFPLFIRFHEPNTVKIGPTRLECALLKGSEGPFAPYAAYYNNGLFEPFSALTSYERVYAESEETPVSVLPLPAENRSEWFSGLFTPCKIDVTAATDEITVGQVLQVDVRVHSDALHGMLELPPLSLQRSLRGRFHVASEMGRTWHPDGTSFRIRVRPLTTNITAFPSLRIQVFDADAGEYHFIQTAAVPLKVLPDDGRDYFEVRTLVAERTLTDQPEGVWHNAQPGIMSPFLNQTIGILADYFWLWMTGITLLFAFLVPWVRERRRRAIHPVYRSQVAAYQELLRQPEGSLQKWEAFLRFLATGFSLPPNAWTIQDTRNRLPAIELSQTDIDLIAETHAIADKSDFSTQKSTASIPELNGVATRLFAKLRRLSVFAVIVFCVIPVTAVASEWSEAEVLFEQAIHSGPGLPETESLFKQAALKFESAAGVPEQRGHAWYNAGNAWFKAGELGRAIACYRQAQVYRPFDDKVRENLKATRALTVDAIEDVRADRFLRWPLRWICAAIVLSWTLFLSLLLVHLRYRTRVTMEVMMLSALTVTVMAADAVYARVQSGREGVVIVGETFGRKGPAYSYDAAFFKPLHDGVEFDVKTQREDWLNIELADGRECWVPAEQTRLIFNER
ncbi:Tetratricopeptide TPR_2 repeat protein [Rhodopirellula maiorica SM1]|uniref:Tetratricopeptide TPR_2 repeat protein n=1 Tax=Rhodopirellula maiorica SM1 TaxID=1265738 RepID=M5RL36_9BACT|nr:tetratricopeptide repeat protein [Rhodopirellula maiorica]EMI20025.1 Tetratricopeptide TPR_2 repeat protein [Rhodopirellula maiorica SM1]